MCYFYCFFALLLLSEVFEGESYLLTIVIFCLLALFVETDVLLFVSDNFDGDFCFRTPLPGEILLSPFQFCGLSLCLLKLIKSFSLLMRDFLKSLIYFAC